MMGEPTELERIIELEIKIKNIKKLKTLYKIPTVIEVLDDILAYLESQREKLRESK